MGIARGAVVDDVHLRKQSGKGIEGPDASLRRRTPHVAPCRSEATPTTFTGMPVTLQIATHSEKRRRCPAPQSRRESGVPAWRSSSRCVSPKTADAGRNVKGALTNRDYGVIAEMDKWSVHCPIGTHASCAQVTLPDPALRQGDIRDEDQPGIGRTSFPPSRPSKIPDIVYKQLVTLITNGHIKPGERLPSERDLAAGHGGQPAVHPRGHHQAQAGRADRRAAGRRDLRRVLDQGTAEGAAFDPARGAGGKDFRISGDPHADRGLVRGEGCGGRQERAT